MPRFKTPDYGLKMIPVDFQRQVLPGSFEFALCHLVDKELDLSALRSRFRNDAGGAPAFDPAVLLKIVLLAYSRGLVSSRSITKVSQDQFAVNLNNRLCMLRRSYEGCQGIDPRSLWQESSSMLW